MQIYIIWDIFKDFIVHFVYKEVKNCSTIVVKLWQYLVLTTSSERSSY